MSPRRLAARIILGVAAAVVLLLAVTADDRPGPIEIPPGLPTVWVTTTVLIPPPPTPAPLVEAGQPTGVAA